jgi:tetratricopeptide (TPR) repeat protein
MARLTDAGRIFLLLIFLAAIFAAARGQKPLIAEDLFKRAQQRLNKNDIEGAIADLTIVIELTSSLPSGKFRARDSPNGAWRIVNTPGTKGVRVVDPRTAVAFNAQGDLRAAIADYDRTLELDPGFARAYNNRGAARFILGDSGGAMNDYNQAIALDPRGADAYRNRGLARYVTGALAEAISDLSQAIALNPREAESYALRGLARLEQGRQTEAESDFAQSFALTPDLRWKLAEGIEEAKRKLAPKR